MDHLYQKLQWRLMPLFCICIILNYLDRTSLAFASIQMTQQLQFSPEVLGLGGGLFFISYCLMQVPSNVICMRVGVARWLSCIMLCWGAVATLFAAVQSKWQFYLLRLLLGLTEAGSFPAVWYGISLFFPPSRASVPFALLNASVAASQVVAAPLAAALLRLDGVAGLAGWQWVFLGEGLPSIALALVLPCLLPGGPARLKPGRLLSQEELQLLRADRELPTKHVSDSADFDSTAALSTAVPVAAPSTHNILQDTNTSAGIAAGHVNMPPAPPAAASVGAVAADMELPQRPVLLDVPLLLRVINIWQIWFLACTEAVKGMSVMALMLWLPVMVNSLLSGGDPTQLAAHPSSYTTHTAHTASPSHSDDDNTGTLAVLLTAIPFSCAAVLTTGLGAVAQHTGNPLVYNFVPNLIGGAAFLAFPWLVHANRVAGFVALSIALASGYASSPHPMAALSQITSQALAQQREAASLPGDSRGRASASASDAQGIALALPMFNTIAMTGGFFGPWLLGVAIERLGGFGAGAVAMGVSMLASGVAVLLLWCLHAPTAAAGRKSSGDVAGDSSQHGSDASSTELMHQARREASTGSDLVGVLRTGEARGMGRGLRGSMRRKEKEDDAAAEQEQLLRGVARVSGDAAEGVSRDADVLACREGSSPRVRFQRRLAVLPQDG